MIVKEKTTVGATRTSLALDLVTEGDLTLAEFEEAPKVIPPIHVPSLTPPQALFQPIEYPPLHIFVSNCTDSPYYDIVFLFFVKEWLNYLFMTKSM